MTTKLEKFLTDLDLSESKLAHWGIKGMHWGIRNSDAKTNPSVDVEKMNNELDQLHKTYTETGNYSQSARTSYLDKREAIIRKHVKDKALADQWVRQSVRHSMDLNSFLAHWGVKGMRWGIRRSDAELARGSADAVRAKETATTIKKSGTLSSVSDADLRHLVSRINLEKSYSDAVTVTKSSTAAKTHSSVRSLLGVGDTMNKAIGFANSPAGKLLASALGQKSTGRHVRR